VGPITAARLTAPSSLPCCSTVALIHESTAVRSATLRTVCDVSKIAVFLSRSGGWEGEGGRRVPVPVTVAPAEDFISSTAELREPSFQLAMARIAPLDASILEVARPIPEAAPVMAITFPLKFVDIFPIG